MASCRRGVPGRCRIGKVSIYYHHGAWWAYYRENGRPARKKLAASPNEAKRIAAQLNAQLANDAPTLLTFQPATYSQLRREFLHYHEHVLQSSVATLKRYSSATHYIEQFGHRRGAGTMAHQIRVDEFVSYLRTLEISANGHANTRRRRLLDKGIRFILETCRAMYHFAGKRRHLPPYAGNPFAELPLERFRIENAKSVWIFDAATELAFLRAADAWSFPVHFTLGKTGLRIGELTHLLIEEVDLADGWLRIENKSKLGWRIKTGRPRSIPLLPESVALIRHVIGSRKAGPVFLRQRFGNGNLPALIADRRSLELIFEQRRNAAGLPRSRSDDLRIAQTIWRDAGAIKSDAIRTSFIRIMRLLGHTDSTCPKSWRHTYATILQDANVDPLVRQITLGHSPASSGGLGMTAIYTHTRPETQRRQIDAALRQWPESLAFAQRFIEAAPQGSNRVPVPNVARHMEVKS